MIGNETITALIFVDVCEAASADPPDAKAVSITLGRTQSIL